MLLKLHFKTKILIYYINMFNNIVEEKALRSTSVAVRLLIFFLSLTFLVSCDDFRINWESQNYGAVDI